MANTVASKETSTQMLPEHPYTHEEIEEYVWRLFDSPIRGQQRKDTIQQRLVHYLEHLPAWVQVLLVECRHAPIRVGPEKTMRLGDGVVANADPYTLALNMVDFPSNDSTLDFEYYLSHEVAHNIDTIVGRHLALASELGKTTYFSEEEAPWSAGLKRDLHLQVSRRTSDLNRGLRKFLSQGYEAEAKPRETFAYILSHYLLEHFRMQAPDAAKKKWRYNRTTLLTNEAEIDAYIEPHFPNLWPYFRDHMRPEALNLATRHYAQRQENRQIAYARIHGRLERSIKYVEQVYNSSATASDGFIEDLARSHHNTWQYVFDALINKPPASTPKRLEILFPNIFDPVWGAPTPKPLLREFSPELRQRAKTFADYVPHTLKDEGIEKFIKYYNALWSDFDREIADRTVARKRTR